MTAEKRDDREGEPGHASSIRDAIEDAGRERPRFRRDARGGLILDDAIAHHISMRLVDDRVLTCTPAGFRAAARAFHAAGARRGLLGFGVADTHAHALVACSRAEAGAFARAVEVALRIVLRLPVPFEPARIRPVRDQGHLGSTESYVHRQQRKHGAFLDRFHDGSSLPDLLGLRALHAVARGGGQATSPLITRLGSHLPRLTPREIRGWADLVLPEGPCDMAPLADAAAGALALPDLAGQDAERTAGRRAAVHVTLAAGLKPRAIAELLATTVRTVYRLATEPSPTDLVRAVSLQLRLRAGLR
jgi:hypothetical protein